MVDVTDKPPTSRTAVAEGRVEMQRDTFHKIISGSFKKGNVLETARIAGIMAAKKTWDLIPMCHPLAVTHVEIDFLPDEMSAAIGIRCSVRLKGGTGVEMEALTGVSVAALTVYDMCKSHDRAMTITDIRLMKKDGGKSGRFERGAGQGAA